MYWKRPLVSHAQMSAKTIFSFLCSDKMCFTLDLAIMVGWGLKKQFPSFLPSLDLRIRSEHHPHRLGITTLVDWA